MNPRVEALIHEQRFEEAAQLAAHDGDSAAASKLWERACRFDLAARCALEAGNPERALLLAVRVDEPEVQQQAMAALIRTPEHVERVAQRLRGVGRPALAARLLLDGGDATAAGRDFEQAGLLQEAATAYETAGRPREAARCLERLLRQAPNRHPARLQLASLLLAHGRIQPALRALQAIPKSAPERVAALPLLHRALSGLDLIDAARDVECEMRADGVDPTSTPAAPTDSVSGEVLFGRYAIEREVARTATARVLKGTDRVCGGLVAVKLFSAPALHEVGRDALRRFEQEARVLGELRHRGIVPLLAYHPEGPAVVLPWMSGGSLADLLDAGPISPARAQEIVVVVLDALEEAHRRGILHRDVKPANVLFDAAGAPYLADFGTAHVSDASATATAGVIGTLAYMAPEQRAGEPATISSDVYGAGALLWHALTGAPPGVGEEFCSEELTEAHAALARKLIAPTSERPPDVPSARALLCSTAWPRTVPGRGTGPRPTAQQGPVRAGSRLAQLDGPLHHDGLLGRDIYVLPADPETLERAAAFSRAGHPRLAAVLRRHSEEGTLWVEALRHDCGPLTPSDIAAIGEALDALHGVGGHHGRVDAEHVARRDGHVMLRFPLAPGTKTAEEDRAALVALAATRMSPRRKS